MISSVVPMLGTVEFELSVVLVSAVDPPSVVSPDFG